MLPRLLIEKRDDILKLAEKHGAYNVRVFGSAVRGEATATSDIDFLVDWDYDRVSAWGGIGFDLELEALLGCAVDVVSAAGLYPPLRDHVLKEAVPL